MLPQLTHEPVPPEAPVRPVGPDQGVIEEARRRQRTRQIRGAVGGLVAAVLVAGLVWTIGGGGSNGVGRHASPGERRTPTRAPSRRGRASNFRGSAPLSGTVPSLRVLHYDVSVTPDLEAGNAGWCSYPRFAISGVPSPYSGGGTCAPSYRPGTPILLAGGEPISNAQDLLKLSQHAWQPFACAQGTWSRRGAMTALRLDGRRWAHSCPGRSTPWRWTAPGG